MHENEESPEGSRYKEVHIADRDSGSSSGEDWKTNFYNRDIVHHDLENNIPLPLLKLVHLFLSKPEFTAAIGIFRINSTKTEEDHIEYILSKKNYARLEEVTDPFVIASKIPL